VLSTDNGYRLHRISFTKRCLRQPFAFGTSDSIVYKIPVVVHVIHLGEPIGTGSNISDEQIKSAITILNESFRKISGSKGDGIRVDVGIEFGFAVRSPGNQTSTGIGRINSGNIRSEAAQSRLWNEVLWYFRGHGGDNKHVEPVG
jgi:hypothetical protein